MTDHDDHAAAIAAEPVEVTHKGTLHTRRHQPTSFTVEVFIIPEGGAVRILGHNPNRCRARVVMQPTTAGPAAVGPTQAVTYATGYPVPSQFDHLEVTATEALWAVALTGGGAASVCVLAEHYDG